MKRIDIFSRVAIAATMLAGTAACNSPTRIDTSYKLSFGLNGKCDVPGQLADVTLNNLGTETTVQLNGLKIRYDGKDKKIETTIAKEDVEGKIEDLRSNGSMVTFIRGGTINTVTLGIKDDQDTLRVQTICPQ